MLKVGGSLKKHNKGNFNMVLLGIIIPILTFFAAVNVTYAYFTARAAEMTDSAATGSLLIKLSTDTQAKINSTVLTGTTKLLPGDTLSIDGTVENAGTNSFYAILQLTITVTKAASGSTAETALSAFYTIQGSTAVKIVETSGTYSAHAFVVDAANEDKTNTYTKAFSLPHVFDGETYNNDYKNASVTYALKAVAIQNVAIESEAVATTELIRIAQTLVA